VHNVVLSHEEQGYQDLDGKPLDQVQRKPIEVVHLYELIKVYREHFGSNDEMLPEDKLIKLPDDVFLVFRVLLVQSLY